MAKKLVHRHNKKSVGAKNSTHEQGRVKDNPKKCKHRKCHVYIYFI